MVSLRHYFELWLTITLFISPLLPVHTKHFTSALLSLALLLFAGSAGAEQLLFNKQSKNGQTDFHYRWKDSKDNQHELKFTYNNKVLFSHFRNFKGYQPTRAKHKILNALEKTAAKVDRKKVNINFVEHKDSIEFKLVGKDRALLQQVEKVLMLERDKTQAKFLYDHYYNTLSDQFGRSGVKPDHVRIAKESTKDISTLTAAFLKQHPNLRIRDMVDRVLSFVQSIPYSTLENRRQSSGAGFNPPLKLLNNNQGDCDSKVTLMANILSSIYPRMQMAIIYLPEHALLAVQVAKRNQERTIKIQGRTLVLVEPTGPAMLPLGEVGKQSAFYINGKQFSYELFD